MGKTSSRERLAFTGLTLKAGRTYRNGHGDIRGPLRQVADRFLDEYGCSYRANGHQDSHHIDSAGNLKRLAQETNDHMIERHKPS